MRPARFQFDDREACGIVKGEEILELDRSFFDSHVIQTATHRLADVELLAPCIPTKIVAVGLNYQDHARESGFPLPENPIIFLKPPTSVIGPGSKIIVPDMSSRIDYEAELGIVIKKTTHCVFVKTLQTIFSVIPVQMTLLRRTYKGLTFFGRVPNHLILFVP